MRRTTSSLWGCQGRQPSHCPKSLANYDWRIKRVHTRHATHTIHTHTPTTQHTTNTYKQHTAKKSELGPRSPRCLNRAVIKAQSTCLRVAGSSKGSDSGLSQPRFCKSRSPATFCSVFWVATPSPGAASKLLLCTRWWCYSSS